MQNSEAQGYKESSLIDNFCRVGRNKKAEPEVNEPNGAMF